MSDGEPKAGHAVMDRVWKQAEAQFNAQADKNIAAVRAAWKAKGEKLTQAELELAVAQ